MMLTMAYVAFYRLFALHQYLVFVFYIIGCITTFIFWLRVRNGKDPSKYVNLWLVILMIYSIFSWFKTGGIEGGGLGYFTGVLLSVIIIKKEWRVKLVNFALILQWILILLDNYAHELPIWGENDKEVYDYMIVSFIILLIVTRLKNNFDSQQESAIQFQDGLRKMYDLQAIRHLPLSSLIEQYLLLGCEILKLENGFVARVDENDELEVIGFLKVRSFSKSGDLKFLREKILETVGQDKLTLIEPIKKRGLYPAKNKGVFYAGLPLVINDETFGVIGFYDESTQKRSLNSFEQELFELMQGNLESLLDIKYLTESREEVDRALTLSEERFKSIYDYADIGICLTDLTNRVLMANHALLKMHGFKEEDIIGQSIEKFSPLDENEEESTQLDFLIRKSIDSYYIEKKNLTNSGNHIFAGVTVSAIKGENEELKYLVRIVNDITNRKQSEEKINALNSKLEEQVKELETANIELESFSYSISHDLRAPLRAIQGYSRMIKDSHSENLGDEGNRLLDVISKNSSKMSRQIEDLLEISRVSRKAIRLSPVEVDEIIKCVIQEYALNPDHIKYEDMPVIFAEKTLIKQVFANLLGNAAKFSANEPHPLIEIQCKKEVDQYEFMIIDNGVGFDMRRYDKLFSVFQRLHREEDFEGTGVGLAIVQKVILKHKGKIWAESELGVGTTFHFTIPRP